jgi:uncharacterized membrane protein HdeD (DUF308 family)
VRCANQELCRSGASENRKVLSSVFMEPSDLPAHREGVPVGFLVPLQCWLGSGEKAQLIHFRSSVRPQRLTQFRLQVVALLGILLDDEGGGTAEGEGMQVNRMDPQDIAGRVGGAWGWVLIFGIVTLLAGIVVMAWPGQTVLVVAVLFAVQILVDGVFNLVRAIGESGEGGGYRVLLLFLGIFSVIVGVLALQNIVQTVAVLVLLLGAYWIVHGIIEAVVAIADRNTPHRGLQITAGLIGVIAGIVVLSYPISSITTLAVILGIWLSLYGIMVMVLAFRLRNVAQSTAGPAQAAPA